MNEADAYRILRLPVTAGLEDIEHAYLKQRAISEDALGSTVDPSQRAELEARLRKLEFAYEIARGRVLEDTAVPGDTAAVRRHRREIIVGAAGLLGVVGIGAYLVLTSKGPAVPELKAEVISPTQVHVGWKCTEKSSPVKGFTLFRKSSGESQETPLPPITDKNQRTYEDQGLQPGTEYIYTIVAQGPSRDSERSKPVKVQTQVSAPKDPRIAIADPAETNRERALRIKWILPSDATITETKLERSDDAGTTWKALQSYKAKQDPGDYTDSNLAPDTEYQYRVVATNETGDTISNIKTGRTGPEAPTGLKVTILPDHALKLTWQGSFKPDSKLVLRTGTSERELSAEEVKRQEVLETGMEPGSSRQYVLVAKNANGFRSAPATVTAIVPPAAPLGLRIKAVGPDFCQVEWDRAITGAKTFELFRSENGQDYSSVQMIPASESQFIDKTVRRGAKYSYKLAAKNAGGLSDMSSATDVVSAVQSQPEPPRLVAKPGVVDGSVQLSWTLAAKDLAAIQKLVVERSNAADGEYKPIKEVAAPVAEQSGATDQHEIAPGTEYFYRIQVYAQDYDNPFTSALESVVVRKQEVKRAGSKRARTVVPAPPATPVGPNVLFGSSR
jgi:fibronectin type 3 domain-containing protein